MKQENAQKVPSEEVKIPTKTTDGEIKKRRIIIETDGNNIAVLEADVGGKIELIAILQLIINYLNRQKD